MATPRISCYTTQYIRLIMYKYLVPKLPLTEWDLRILEVYPHMYELAYYDCVYDAVDSVNHMEKNTYTWKGPKFFFKKEVDYIWFVLRWS